MRQIRIDKCIDCPFFDKDNLYCDYFERELKGIYVNGKPAFCTLSSVVINEKYLEL